MNAIGKAFLIEVSLWASCGLAASTLEDWGARHMEVTEMRKM